MRYANNKHAQRLYQIQDPVNCTPVDVREAARWALDQLDQLHDMVNLAIVRLTANGLIDDLGNPVFSPVELEAVDVPTKDRP